jgi:sugar/nucleoside kinase (ribokinase family)
LPIANIPTAARESTTPNRNGAEGPNPSQEPTPCLRIPAIKEAGNNIIQVLKAKNVLVAADMQGFVRILRGAELKYAAWPEMAATLGCVDVVKSDAIEAEFLTGETDIYKAAKFYADMGPK